MLNSLLKDRTTGRNIIWVTDNYKRLGAGYKFKNQITAELITGENGGIIKPRVLKDQEEQKSCTKKHAEVFTPSWVCDYMNRVILDDKIKDLPWQEYVQKTWLEITCGEAPYIVSRYDTVSGKYILIEKCIEFLDRKLRAVNKRILLKKIVMSSGI